MKKTLTIGIPAMNEEANILHLMNSLLQQNYNLVNLNKIIVVSDGSTDETVKLLRSLKNSKIIVIDRKKRLGALATQNEILENSKDDILVMLDADILPSGKNFIDEICRPIIINSKVGLVGADTISLKGSNFFENVIATSHEFKKSIYYKINNGNNIYLCHGRARAFAKNYYKSLQWGKESPEDAFSYLECFKKGFEFKFTNKAKVYFKSPSNFKDHARQSMRFEKGRRKLGKIFGYRKVKKEYEINKLIILKQFFVFLFKYPVEIVTYFFVKLYIDKFLSNKTTNLTSWEIAVSSKKLK